MAPARWLSQDTFTWLKFRDAGAMAAYSPIDMKVFGSSLMEQMYKFIFLHSLEIARLLNNVHVLVLSVKDVRRLNGVYMRVLRRIAGDTRFGHAELNDLQVRASLGQPSLDCLLVRARIKYAGRLMRLRPRALLALLHMQRQGRRLQCVKRLLADLDIAVARSSRHEISQMPSAASSPNSWANILIQPASCDQLVDSIHFVESICDNVRLDATPGQRSMAYACASCDKLFASQRTLESHRRAKHGDKLGIRMYVPSAVCPCCGNNYRQRLRCIAI